MAINKPDSRFNTHRFLAAVFYKSAAHASKWLIGCIRYPSAALQRCIAKYTFAQASQVIQGAFGVQMNILGIKQRSDTHAETVGLRSNRSECDLLITSQQADSHQEVQDSLISHVCIFDAKMALFPQMQRRACLIGVPRRGSRQAIGIKCRGGQSNN